jgi:hypothetical protein
MYTFQFMDGTWRIAKLTSSQFGPPVRGEALALYNAAYSCRADAVRAIARIREIGLDPEENSL